MIKSVEVMNKTQAEEYSLTAHNKESIVISIASRGCNTAFIMPNTINKIADILYVQFNDTDDTDMLYGGIEDTEAIKIVDFIEKYNSINTELGLIVHCEAGQSRSAGVAAAIMKYLYNDDTPIFNNSRYTPNMLCYRKVLNSLAYRNGEITWTK